MTTFKRSFVAFFSGVVLLAAALVPALASAQYYPYNNNCYGNNGYSNYNCTTQGSVTIYTQVSNQYGGSASPSSFTLYVSGATSGQQYVTGSQNGTTVWVSGAYSVSLYNQSGYTASYSSGCSGTIMNNQTAVCYVTLTSSYNNQYPYQYPYYQPYVAPVYQQPVTVVAKYVPTLPNTGFEPISSASFAFAAVLLLAAIALALPYVRKALAVILG